MAAWMRSNATILGLLLLLPITSVCFSRGGGLASFASIPLRNKFNALASSREALQGEYFFGRIPSKNGTSHHHDDDVLMYQKERDAHAQDGYDDTTFFERQLLEGYMSHQQLLLDYTPDVDADERIESIFYEEPQSEALTTTTSSHAAAPPTDIINYNQPSFILNDVWKARLLLLLSAALYGTNFSVVKSLDEIIPVGVSSTLRFGLAAFAMLPCLIAPLSDELKNNLESATKKTTYAFMEPSRLSVGLAGMEIGLWNSIGYLSQAIGLRTTAASTVRKSVCVINFLVR